MAMHMSWYRKYRPQTFEDVVGQPHVQRTLRNAVSENAVAHAYLFTGPRGTGKTSMARILAKSLNCEKGPTPEPDDACEQCRAITEGTHPDVQELDAASRTGVDEVREQIISRLSYAPSQGRWKVYIIDEVHMLSTPAFNALLKSLEEPPVHTVFVLCTTHPHKVPETIQSRCQRFDFHRLSTQDIEKRLRAISDAESVEVPDAALTLIARHASGGMRDAIATLEQLASFGGGTIGLEDVENLLGEVGADQLFEAATLILERDVAGAFRFVAGLADGGMDIAEFVRALVQHFRDLFIISVAGEDAPVDATPEDRGRLQSQAAGFGSDRLGRVLDILDRLSTDLRHVADQRLALEVAMVRMARPESDLTLEALAERVDALESGASLRSPSRPSRQEKPRETKERTGVLDMAPPVPVSTGKEGRLDTSSVKRAWPAVLAEIKKIRAPRAYIFNGTEAEVVSDALVVEFPADQAFALELARESETVEVLRRAVRTVLGQEPPVEYRLGRSGSSSDPARPAGVEAPGASRAEDASEEEVQAGQMDDAPEERQSDRPGKAQGTADLERAILAELGGEIIDEGSGRTDA